jgi:mono/diheme cytochrome c family protein
VLVVAVVLALALAGADDGRAGAGAHQLGVQSETGSPERGRAVYLSNGCAGCHGPPPSGSAASVGPQLTPELLRSSAQSAGKPLGSFVAESILVPNAFTSPGYVSGLMRPFASLSKQQLDDLVSFLIGSSYTSPASGPIKLPARPAAACKASSACRATVARWAKAERLPSAVLDGARITAVVGCLSCHRYAGSGKRSGSAPELTRIGLRKLSADALVKRLRCPTCVVEGSVMPSYAALGPANLRAIVEFLRASKGVKP